MEPFLLLGNDNTQNRRPVCLQTRTAAVTAPWVLGRALLGVCLVLPFLVLMSSAASAQFNTGEIGGLVRDASGGGLPGATVTARSPPGMSRRRRRTMPSTIAT